PSERQWGRSAFEPSEELREPTIGAVGRDRSFAELKDNVKILRVFPTGQQFLRLNLEGFRVSGSRGRRKENQSNRLIGFSLQCCALPFIRRIPDGIRNFPVLCRGLPHRIGKGLGWPSRVAAPLVSGSARRQKNLEISGRNAAQCSDT